MLRKCRFPISTEIGMEPYSCSKCICRCRIPSILALCGCIPFFYESFNQKHNPAKICTVDKVPCFKHNNVNQFNCLFLFKIMFNNLMQNISQRQKMNIYYVPINDELMCTCDNYLKSNGHIIVLNTVITTWKKRNWILELNTKKV